MKDELLESKISVRVDDDTKAYIQKVADLESVTVSEFVRRLLSLDYRRRMRN